MIGGAATAAATAVLALMVVLDFNGCSKASNKMRKLKSCKSECFRAEHGEARSRRQASRWSSWRRKWKR